MQCPYVLPGKCSCHRRVFFFSPIKVIYFGLESNLYFSTDTRQFWLISYHMMSPEITLKSVDQWCANFQVIIPDLFQKILEFYFKALELKLLNLKNIILVIFQLAQGILIL